MTESGEELERRIVRLLTYPFVWLFWKMLDPRAVGNEEKVKEARARSAKIDDWSEAKQNDDWY
jgi:hypothetical protein